MSPQRQKRILVTRNLKGEQLAYARMLGLDTVVKPALEFEFPEYWDEVLKTINKHRSAGWVFTSKNGVRALSELRRKGLGVLSDRIIYAVGHKTREALEQQGLNAEVPFRQNAEGLANLIIEQGEVKSVIYFKGNRSRDTIPQMLRENDIDVYDLEVYKTRLNKIDPPDKTIDAVLFYSPSAVKAYSQSVGFNGEDYQEIFAIGPTTREAVQEYTDKEVHIPSDPSTESLLRKVAEQLDSRI